MKFLNIHPRLLSFFAMIVTLNLIISISTQYATPSENSFAWFMNLILPFWLAIVIGFPIGLILYLIPQDEKDFIKRMFRSQVFGIMIVSFVLFVMYLYQILLTGPRS